MVTDAYTVIEQVSLCATHLRQRKEKAVEEMGAKSSENGVNGVFRCRRQDLGHQQEAHQPVKRLQKVTCRPTHKAPGHEG